MVARKLRIESLEARRLFAADLDLVPRLLSNQEAIPFELASEPTDKTLIPEPVMIATADVQAQDAVTMGLPPLMVGCFDQMGSPFLIETEHHLVAARPSNGFGSTELHILTRQEDGTALETSKVQLDFQLERMLRLGNDIVAFGSKYNSDLSLQWRFVKSPESVLVVVDPSSGEIKYQTSLSGAVIQAVELPSGIAFETSTIHYAPLTSNTEETVGDGDLPVEVTTSSQFGEYQLGYLYSTDESVGINWQPIDAMTTLALFQGSLITLGEVPPASAEATEDASKFIVQRWQVIEQKLQPAEQVQIPRNRETWDYIQSFETSPDGSKLLLSQVSQKWIQDSIWLQSNTLTWLSLDDNGLSIAGSYTVEGSIGAVRWIGPDQIVLFSYDVLDQAQILDISDPTNPSLSTFTLSQRLQLNQIVPIDETHVALIGFTPVTPIPVAENGEKIPEIVPMVEAYRAQGAIVILDLATKEVTDERIFASSAMFDPAFAVKELPGHFAWHGFYTFEDWTFEESVYLGTIDEAGKLVIVDDLKLGSNWSYSISNGESLTILSDFSLEQRNWRDLDQPTWRMDLTPIWPVEIEHPSEPIPGEKKEVLRGEIEEEIFSTTLTPPVDLPMDTNGDGAISPIDILQVINYINRAYLDEDTDELLNVPTDTLDRFDFDGDSKILPSDALMMIASLNVVHATFEMIDDTTDYPELPDEPCFWDMVLLESELPTESIEASVNEFLGSLIEIEQSTFDPFDFDAGYWAWFAPWDPLADKLKQELYTDDDSTFEELS